MRPILHSLALATLLAAPVVAQTPADSANARFMAGMIHHHTQALAMAGLIPTHGASAELRILGERIIVSQRDEIAMMAGWLRERRWPVPDTVYTHQMHHDGGHNENHHRMPGHMDEMPGMLTSQQLAGLDAARGNAFDHMFLLLMIQHHRGAITMVERLLASPGAGQDPLVLRMAQDISADQQAEINRMSRLMASLPTPRSNQ